VIMVGALIRWARTAPLPAPLAIALALDASAHLGGGLINVGDGVLYNAHITSHVTALHTNILQYDHLVHSFGSFLAAITLWVLLAPPTSDTRSRRAVIVLCVLGSLGIGAINEVIEFTATLAHQGAGVGGYANTGWDLISNSLGALAAALVIQRMSHDAARTS
jgi:uncharacterized membrane protein YjdF